MKNDNESRNKRLDIFGIGARGAVEITLEANAFVRSADVAYVLTQAEDVLAYLKDLSIPIVQLTDHHRNCKDPGDIYRGMAERLISESSRWNRAVMLVSGNPWLLCKPVQLLAKDLNRDFQVFVYAGISCLDQIPTVLGRDITLGGLQIMETSRMMLYSLEINPAMDLLLLQPAAFHSGRFTDISEVPGKIYQRLVEYLGKYYASNHPLIIVEAGTEPKIVDTPLNELADCFQDISYACSIYVPADLSKRGFNQDFADKYAGVI